MYAAVSSEQICPWRGHCYQYLYNKFASMGRGRDLKTPDIAAITHLCKAGHTNKEISDLTGITLRTVQRWNKIFRESGFNNEPPPVK